MTVIYKDFKRYLFILFSFIGALIAILVSNAMIVHLLAILFLTAIAVFQSKFNFSHPYFWFSAFFFLYNCAYMIILIIAPFDSTAKGYNPECGLLIVIALGTALLVFDPHVNKYDYQALSNPESFKNDISILSFLMWTFLIIQIVATLLLYRQGVTEKSVQWKDRNMFWIIATYCTRFNAYIIAILIFMGDNLKRKKLVVICALVSTLFFSLLTGERDAILRLVIILILCLAMTGKIGFKQLIVLIPAGIAGMILLNYFKYFLRTGVLNRGTFVLSNTIYEFLYSDFVDCGSNLQVLTSHPELSGCKGVGVLITDLMSSFIPASIMNRLFGDVSEWNMSEWYNNYFYKGSTWSRAFTIVGEGYVISGVIGVIVVFVIVSLLIRFLYKNSCRNPYYAAFYIYSAVTIISSFRGDLATIYTYVVRTPVFLLILICLVKKFVYRYRKTL